MISNPSGCATTPDVNLRPVQTWKFGTSPQSLNQDRGGI